MGLLKPNIKKLKENQNIKGLIKACKYKKHSMIGKDIGLRQTAEFALMGLKGEKAVEPLIEALTDEYVKLRRFVTKILGQIGDRRAVEPLIRALEDKDFEVQKNAIIALGKLGDKRAVEPLIQVLQNKVSRWDAIVSLGLLRDQKVVNPLIQVLGDKTIPILFKEKVGETLVGIGKPSVEPLIHILEVESDDVKIIAANTLKKIGDGRAVDPFIKTLGDKNDEIRKIATEAMKELGGKRAVQPLIRALKDKNNDVRRQAAEALGNIGDHNACKPLVKALQDKDWFVLAKVGKSLEKLGWAPKTDTEKAWSAFAKSNWDGLVKLGSAAVEPLHSALDDDRDYHRQAAVDTLIRIGEPAKASLKKALKDKDSTIRRNVVYALREMGETSTKGLLAEKEAEVQIERLSSSLKEEYYRTAIDAAEILGNMREERAVGSLIRALSCSYTDASLAAGYALEKIGKPAVEPLIQALKTQTTKVQNSIVGVLAEIGDARALKPLKRFKCQGSYTQRKVDLAVKRMEKK